MSFQASLFNDYLKNENSHLKQENELLKQENKRLKKENTNLKLLFINDLNQPTENLSANSGPSKPRPLVSESSEAWYHKNTPRYPINPNLSYTQQTNIPKTPSSTNEVFDVDNANAINQANNYAIQKRIEAGNRAILNQELEFYCNICHIGFSSIFEPECCPGCGRLYEPIRKSQYPY